MFVMKAPMSPVFQMCPKYCSCLPCYLGLWQTESCVAWATDQIRLAGCLEDGMPSSRPGTRSGQYQRRRDHQTSHSTCSRYLKNFVSIYRPQFVMTVSQPLAATIPNDVKQDLLLRIKEIVQRESDSLWWILASFIFLSLKMQLSCVSGIFYENRI